MPIEIWKRNEQKWESILLTGMAAAVTAKTIETSARRLKLNNILDDF